MSNMPIEQCVETYLLFRNFRTTSRNMAIFNRIYFFEENSCPGKKFKKLGVICMEPYSLYEIHND